MTAQKLSKYAAILWLLCLLFQFLILRGGNDVPSVIATASTLSFWAIFLPLFYDWSRSRTSAEDRALFLLELADLMKLAIPPDEALRKLVEIRSHGFGHRFAPFSNSLAKVSERLSLGESLDSAFREVEGVPRHWGSFAHFCEEPEELSVLLEELAEAELSSLRMPFLSALRVQLMLPILIGVFLFTTVYIMPTFVELYKGMNLHLPWATKVLIAGSETASILQLGWIVGLLALVLFLAIPFLKLRRLCFSLLYYMPGLSGLVKFDCQRLILKVVGTGLKHGVPQGECLRAAGEAVGVGAYRKFLVEVESENEPSLARAFSGVPHLFSPKLVWLVNQGESLENLPEALITAAELANVELELRCTKLSTNADTFILVLIGVLVGLGCVGTLLPLYEIMEGLF